MSARGSAFWLCALAEPRPGVCEVSVPARATLSGTPTESPRRSERAQQSCGRPSWVGSSSSVPSPPGAGAAAGVARPARPTLGGLAELHRKDAPAWAPAALAPTVGRGRQPPHPAGRPGHAQTASGQALRLGSRSQIAIICLRRRRGTDARPHAGPARTTAGSGSRCCRVAPRRPRSRSAPGPPSSPSAARASGFAGRGRRPARPGPHGSAVCAGPDKQWERTLTGPQQLPSRRPGVPARRSPSRSDPSRRPGSAGTRTRTRRRLGGGTPSPEDRMSLEALVVGTELPAYQVAQFRRTTRGRTRSTRTDSPASSAFGAGWCPGSGRRLDAAGGGHAWRRVARPRAVPSASPSRRTSAIRPPPDQRGRASEGRSHDPGAVENREDDVCATATLSLPRGPLLTRPDAGRVSRRAPARRAAGGHPRASRRAPRVLGTPELSLERTTVDAFLAR